MKNIYRREKNAMHGILFKRMTAVLFLTVFALCMTPIHTVSAGLFGRSWIKDESIYWTDGGIGLLPDSFDELTIPGFDLEKMSKDLLDMCNNLENLVRLIDLSGVSDCDSFTTIIYAYRDYISNLNAYAYNLSGYIKEYNNDPGDTGYTILMQSVTNDDMANKVEDWKNLLLNHATTSITAKYGILADDFSSKPGYWTYKYLYDELKAIDALAYYTEYEGPHWCTNLARNPYITASSATKDNVTADPFWANSLDSLYNNFTNAIESLNTYRIYSLADVEEKSKGVEKSLTNLIVRTGTNIYNKLSHNGVDIQTIIFGRVASGGATPVAVNSFQFELEFKNVYGVIGAVVYTTLRSLIVLGIIIAGLFLIVKGAITHSPRVKDTLKSNVVYAIIALIALYATPVIVHFIVYFKDVLLSILGKTLNQFASKEQIKGLTALYYDIATDKYANFLDGCMYFGFVILSIYFSVVYIAAACSLTIVFAFFPLFLLLSFKDKKLIGTWFNYVIGTVATPVIDCVLLHMPVIAAELHAPELLRIFMCYAIIPSRGVIRRLLGIGAGAGSEMLGVGALMMAGRAAGGLVRTARNGANRVITNGRQAAEDKRSANRELELAKAESSESSAVGSSLSRSGYVSSTSPAARRGAGPEPLEKLNYKTAGDYQLALSNAQIIDNARNKGLPIEEMRVKERAHADFNAILKNNATESRNKSLEADVARQEAEVRAIYGKYANRNNFENPEIFNALSHEQKAELYRQKARYNQYEAVGGGIGLAAGGVVGGTYGFAAGSMLGPSASGMMTMLGASAGAGVGEMGGLAIGRGVAEDVDNYSEWAKKRAANAKANVPYIRPSHLEEKPVKLKKQYATQKANAVLGSLNRQYGTQFTVEDFNKSIGDYIDERARLNDPIIKRDIEKYVAKKNDPVSQKEFAITRIPSYAGALFSSNGGPDQVRIQNEVEEFFGKEIGTPENRPEYLNATREQIQKALEDAYNKYVNPPI